MEAPIARDSGIESNPIPSSMPAPPPFFSAMISANVKMMAPAKNANVVKVIPRLVSASMTISNIAAAINIPASNAVKNNICCSEKFLFLAINAPRKDVPPANVVIAITVRISVIPNAVVISHLTRRIYCVLYIYDSTFNIPFTRPFILYAPYTQTGCGRTNNKKNIHFK